MPVFQIIPDPLHLEESIALAEEYGLGFEYNDFFSPQVLTDEKKCDELIARYEGIKVPGPVTSHGDFFDVLVFSEDEEIRRISLKRIRQSLEISERLGAVGTVFHSNISPHLYSDLYTNAWTDRNEECWRAVCGEFPHQQIWLENMFDSDPVRLKVLAERLKDVENFGLCFDYAHANCFGAAHDIDEWAKTLAPYTKHVHINDNDGVMDLHKPVGEGQIDWYGFKRHLEEHMSDASVLVENTGVEAQKISLQYLKKLGLL
ncbi:MAG: sugar phosphate isomerase/epimerase [Lachnospiraceae bacterium]|nr:sugar phosphate isomerase/epimerase [Lachnospiraceae bacterium]